MELESESEESSEEEEEEEERWSALMCSFILALIIKKGHMVHFSTTLDAMLEAKMDKTWLKLLGLVANRKGEELLCSWDLVKGNLKSFVPGLLSRQKADKPKSHLRHN